MVSAWAKRLGQTCSMLVSAVVVGHWLISQQQGYESPHKADHVYAQVPMLDRSGLSPSSADFRSESLLRASDLLKQSAYLLDKNERLAARLIREAIGILRHEVLRGMGTPDHDRVSLNSKPTPDEIPLNITSNNEPSRKNLGLRACTGSQRVSYDQHEEVFTTQTDARSQVVLDHTLCRDCRKPAGLETAAPW